MSSDLLDTRGLDVFLNGLSDAVDRGVDETADVLVQFEITLCPVIDEDGPGHTHLYETIRKEGEAGSGRRDVIAGDPARGVEHAPHVNYGTERMAARPFVEPAAKQIDAGSLVAKQIAILASKSST